MTTAFHEQGRKRMRAYENYELDSTQNIASPSNGEFELAKKALNSTVGKQSLQKRIVRGLANRHFTSNLAAQGIFPITKPETLLNRATTTSIGQQSLTSRPKTIVLDPSSAAYESKRRTISRKFERRRAGSKITANSPMSQHYLQRAASTTSGTIANHTTSSALFSKTTALLKNHGRLLSPDLTSLLQKELK